MFSRVRVSAPSHVHAGNYDIEGSIGRLYGTVGLALGEPRLTLEASPSHSVEVEGGSRRREAEDLARLYLDKVGSRGCRLEGVKIRIYEEIPAHVGLGSTTALALSIGSSIYRICGLEPLDLRELAVTAGRSLVSALGLYSFEQGGLIVDGGFVRGERRPPPLVFRAHVPGSVKVVVALPERPIAKILDIKRREDELLARMPPMDPSMAGWASRVVLLGIMANAAEGRWGEAARWMGEFNRRLGEYWAGEQGGIYCCSEVEEIVRAMVDAGAWSGLQSSWGPTVYGLTPARRAASVLEAARRAVERVGGGKVWVTSVDNVGAVISSF
ncbi:conserved hypothetical protein [Aeropyrum pernix K1]|uniref:Beta-ribofuranosylaminobenzene 5'-phosphate synthase n=2 Tax=Aeropyrum pernix TaxID=56636 RepID=Q9Y960_AERPE|nr:conserved hypothetical protein [Aeropyrum pernix K1]